ncbi:hypothetical protein A2313_00430 [Candidatus Roizmanbacteria bacterium RIFOXYB2_FULL_41_10]|uniref:RCK N-terminal domain-containing protein n=1 Tax=Candidatus Roizmanbacteria bacterium RIFOXYA1_FULL_41_12 TaxID=1802082 RepID=A0A1F7KAL4_9BACT|nr:MAG: hypothetical protein A2262_01430 [Candidatus Roizmanbacteria bacterium RIFOXYA2_FULL_41_8]OGK64891.1 MAG: hypothetical protein A2209_04290 [Candidatus Roizmanbacteria bacterium RIFOXYA1_FULL_41_12]OGK66848.1 MAG: hypothetical protein A2377_03035 [Candidatus Roizmanbacteria bacterium RIFOXYB1_FULL_41_27]OGK70778.1 MAG: hypothetical protein A2403_01670 [Candidatus Roizmanbacteria bacterium RIFOXYC1_FULL_41_16]OGK71430.1 MAG: hypothetical protein A2313_00430 [Candidatus Roizmanbacteria bac
MLSLNSLFLILSAILLTSLFGSVLAGKLQKPSLIFYIILGLCASNLFLNNEAVKSFFEPLSNLGIVLLLFTIGLELSLQRLFSAGRLLITGSVAQVVITGLILAIPSYLLIHSLMPALLVGLTLAMSSTAVVGKLLQSRAEDASVSGEVTLSILIFQDLVSVVAITLLTFLVGKSQGGLVLAWLFVQKVALIALSFYLLTKIINLVFDKLRLNREELALFTFALLFLLIGLFGYFSIPETTAGFIIGLLLAGRREQHEIFSQVRVFRDVLLVLFFFFLGTYITNFNPLIMIGAFGAAFVLMVIKFVVLWLIFIVLGLHQKTAFWVSFDLMQIGEFAFILLTLMSRSRLIGNAHYQFLVMVITASLLLFSFVYRSKLKFYRWFNYFISRHLPFLKHFSTREVKMVFDQLKFDNHIVLCGYGRVGSYIGHGLILSQLPLVVIDTDADRIKKLLHRGVKAVYGDATEPEILDYAQVEKAKFLILSVPSSIEQEQIILEARRINPDIRILTRTHLSSNLRHFKALGVSQVIQPEFEAAITLLKKILKLYNLEKPEIKKRLQYLKMEHGIQE